MRPGRRDLTKDSEPPELKIPPAEYVGSAVNSTQFPEDGLPFIAIAGRSNAGKSSFINALLQRRQLAQVSSTPGKTRTVNFYRVGQSFHLADMPGLGYAKVGGGTRATMEESWKSLLESSRLKGMLYLIDVRVPQAHADEEALEHFSNIDLPVLVLATKTDKLSKSQCIKAIQAMTKGMELPIPPIPVSSRSGEGRVEVWTQIDLLLQPPTSKPT